MKISNDKILIFSFIFVIGLFVYFSITKARTTYVQQVNLDGLNPDVKTVAESYKNHPDPFVKIGAWFTSLFY